MKEQYQPKCEQTESLFGGGGRRGRPSSGGGARGRHRNEGYTIKSNGGGGERAMGALGVNGGHGSPHPTVVTPLTLYQVRERAIESGVRYPFWLRSRDKRQTFFKN